MQLSSQRGGQTGHRRVRIRARFEPLGFADDLVIPPREPGRDPPKFD